MAYLRRIASEHILRRHSVEDLAQDTLLVAWRRYDPAHHGINNCFLAYLKQCALNCVRNHARTERRKKRAPETRLLPIQCTGGVPDTLDDPSDAIDFVEDVTTMNHALRRLDEKDRSLLIKYYYLGASLKELGKQQKISPSGARKQISRAELRLLGVFLESRARREP